MSALANPGNAQQRAQNAHLGERNSGGLMPMRLKSHYLNFNGLVLDLGASYSDHP